MNLETTFLNDNNLSLNITFTQDNMLYDDIVNIPRMILSIQSIHIDIIF